MSEIKASNEKRETIKVFKHEKEGGEIVVPEGCEELF